MDPFAERAEAARRQEQDGRDAESGPQQALRHTKDDREPA
jgi:hypothetical protein